MQEPVEKEILELTVKIIEQMHEKSAKPHCRAVAICNKFKEKETAKTTPTAHAEEDIGAISALSSVTPATDPSVLLVAGSGNLYSVNDKTRQKEGLML